MMYFDLLISSLPCITWWITGLSGTKTRHLYNNLCELIVHPSRKTEYLEVGSFAGSTLVSSIYHNTGTYMKSLWIDPGLLPIFILISFSQCRYGCKHGYVKEVIQHHLLSTHYDHTPLTHTSVLLSFIIPHRPRACHNSRRLA